MIFSHSPTKVVVYAPTRVYFRDGFLAGIAAYPGLDLTVIHRHNDWHQTNAASDSPAYETRYTNPTRDANPQNEAHTLVRLLRELDPDILITHGYVTWHHQLAAWFQKARRRPLLMRENINLLYDRPLKSRVAKQVGLRATLQGATGLYVGSMNKEWFRHYGVPDERLYFTPYAVDNEFFRIRHEQLLPQRSVLRARFDLPDADMPVILTVCRLTEMKGLPGLLTAFGQLRQTHPAALVIAGDGPLRASLEQQVVRAGIPDVHFLGQVGQAELTALYTTADLFVLNSLFDETWGVVVNEAMNCSLPIVVSNMVGSGYDLVRSGENGFVIPAGNTATLIEKMSLLVSNPEMRALFGGHSRELIVPWNHDIAAAGAIAAIEDAVRRSGR